MSLVLDALRRQQSEDDQGTAVALALANERQRRQRTWLIVFSAALLLNAALFAWLFRDRLLGPSGVTTPATATVAAPDAAMPASGAAGTATDAGSATTAPAPAIGSTPQQTLPPMGAPGTVATAPPAVPANGYPPSSTTGTPPPYGYPTQPWTAPPGTAPQPVEAPPPRVLERIALDALPPAARSRFPGIVISTHVYAEDPTLRAIVVNGARLQEGDQVAGMTLREINEFGVVLEFESYLVDVPVFTDWEE